MTKVFVSQWFKLIKKILGLGLGMTKVVVQSVLQLMKQILGLGLGYSEVVIYYTSFSVHLEYT